MSKRSCEVLNLGAGDGTCQGGQGATGDSTGSVSPFYFPVSLQPMGPNYCEYTGILQV
jgi:hypothetical protein